MSFNRIISAYKSLLIANKVVNKALQQTKKGETMYKKTLTSLLIAGMVLITGAANASWVKNLFGGKTEITVYDMNSKGNPGRIITQAWIDELNNQGFDVKFRPGLRCGGRDAYVGDNGKAIGISFNGRLWGSLHRGEDQCLVDLNKVTPVSTYEYIIGLCKRADNPATITDLRDKGGYTVALNANGNPHREWVLDVNRQYGVANKPLTNYKNSGAVSLGLLSGDADFGLLSMLTAKPLVEQGKLACVGTTDPADANEFKKVFSKVHPLLNGFNGGYIVTGRNLSSDEAAKITKVIAVTGKKLVQEGKTALLINDKSPKEIATYVNDMVQGTVKVTAQFK